jgi:hypothetical protein
MLTVDDVLAQVDAEAEEGLKLTGCHASSFDLTLYAIRAVLRAHGVEDADYDENAEAAAHAILTMLEQ